MTASFPLIDWIENAPPLPSIHFPGTTYDASFDFTRLNDQQRRVWDAMRDGVWRTLAEIGAITGDPEASISARLRCFNNHDDLKDFFQMESRRRSGCERRGGWEYQVRMKGRPE